MDQLTKEEMVTLKGGYWVYDENSKEWYWIQGYDLD